MILRSFVKAYEHVCHYYDFISINMFLSSFSGSWKGGSSNPLLFAEKAEYWVVL